MLQKQVLIVEDNLINRTILASILSPHYAVLEAEDGQQALELLRAQKDEITLVLLDLIMPVMDGYTFLAIVKADPELCAIPVIVTTQNDSEADEVAALSHGAADFVAKPYRPQILLHRVASIIHLLETAAMVHQFQYDHLTGLFSKAFFYQRAKEYLPLHPDQEYDIVCADVENFKLVNDVFGTPTGDRLLQGLGQVYSQLAEETGLCCRFNADQFACLIAHNTYTDETFQQLNGQMNALAQTKSVVTRWGIYQIQSRDVPIEQMCDRALLAARSVKGQYGRHFALYDDTLRNKLLREQAITESMEPALAQDQFVVYLQPKYSISTGKMAGVEALVRWNHPEWGFLSPAEFIPLFERNGFISQLDRFVWEEACAMLRHWSDMGYPPTAISVNVSRADIYQADVAEILTGLMAKYRLSPSSLHLEITESAYTENPEQIIARLGQLRELGFVIEMDDFGTGYSSLNMLTQMPLDVLKLDMSFIRSETAKATNDGILHFIMGIARWMSLSVVAEGVETAEQLQRLREVGCDDAQGYFFARPMPREAFETLLAQSPHD